MVEADCCRLGIRPGVQPGFFSKGADTLCQSEGNHLIVMAFSPPVVGSLLKKGLQKGGGSQASQDPPSYALASDRLLPSPQLAA